MLKGRGRGQDEVRWVMMTVKTEGRKQFSGGAF